MTDIPKLARELAEAAVATVAIAREGDTDFERELAWRAEIAREREVLNLADRFIPRLTAHLAAEPKPVAMEAVVEMIMQITGPQPPPTASLSEWYFDRPSQRELIRSELAGVVAELKRSRDEFAFIEDSLGETAVKYRCRAKAAKERIDKFLGGNNGQG